MDEAALTELLNFVAGRGRFTMLGGGVHTFPGRDDNQQALHDGCLELERRGQVERVIDDEGHCYWRPKG